MPEKIQAPKDLNFVKTGRLNMICVRDGKNVGRVDVDSPQFLNNEQVVKQSNMNNVTFHSNCIFKLTLDFKKQLPCVEGIAVRESTDWVLCSANGHLASFNRNDEKLTLQNCLVCVQSNVEQLLQPFHAILHFENNEWIVEKLWR